MEEAIFTLELLDTIDFVWTDGSVVFRTCAREKDQLIFQIVTLDPISSLS